MLSFYRWRNWGPDRIKNLNFEKNCNCSCYYNTTENTLKITSPVNNTQGSLALSLGLLIIQVKHPLSEMHVTRSVSDLGF